MKKEVEFRAIRTDGNGWAYGSLLYSNEGCNYILPIDAKTLLEVKEIKEETIGQYIGIKDKNGKKVYEDDVAIVSSFGKPYRKVYVWYDSENAIYKISSVKEDEFLDLKFLAHIVMSADREFEVIGNLHEIITNTEF